MTGLFNQLSIWASFLTHHGIKLMPYKIVATTNFARPISTKNIRAFVGLVNQYKDMWPKRAHFLAPLTDLCNTKRKFQWTDIHEHSFQQVKCIVAKDVLLQLPNHSQPFSIYTDASNYQIGATIKQEGLPVAYFSRKLTPTQRRYPTTKQFSKC